MAGSGNKIVIYSAITNGYDQLFDPLYINSECDYICYADYTGIYTGIWSLRAAGDYPADNVKRARKYKILPHLFFPEYGYSVWVDGNISITGDMNEFITAYLKNSPMACLKHPVRSCAYQEAQACIFLKKDDDGVIRRQMRCYRECGYPEKNGLIQSSVIIRRHNDQNVIKVMEEWWSNVEGYSRRDQLSFNYAAWKNSFKYDEVDIDLSRNKYFAIRPHVPAKVSGAYYIHSFGLLPDIKQVRPAGGSTLIKQYFRSPLGGLSGVKLLLSATGRRNLPLYRFLLAEAEGNKVVRAVNLQLSMLLDNRFLQVGFRPVTDSQNKEYYFSISPMVDFVQNPVAFPLSLPHNSKQHRLDLYNDRSIVFQLIYGTLPGVSSQPRYT